MLVAAIVFAGVSAFRVIVLIAALLPPSESRVAVTAAMSNDELPTYSVLVPLYREAAIVPSLIDALAALDYPRGKLDVALILEESDIDTRLAVARANMPAYMRVIIVPDRQPRTKPKALNVALTLSNSMLVAVFDAEDIPAPDQLRKAAAAFAAVPGCYSCLQARLTIYNSRQSWVTRQFALEYATLFQAFLPALVRLGFPLPLSGTSNHFPRTALHQAVAWDPYNVTEDADLGIRMARAGCRIGLLDCATREEAPPTFRHWLPQRTRWIKGWMQTYLVHTREPWRLLRQMGLWRTVGFHAIFAGYLLSLLAFPIMLVVAGIELTQPAPFARTPGSIQHTALMIAVTDLLIGTVAALLTGLISARRAGLGDLAGHLLAAPIYWLCISAAGYRALAQMFWNQHLWEKTEHAPRRRLRARKKALKHLRPRGARR
ncbi:MAG: glycosyltransferase family 2 protein [Hyphomicrobiaceae bacterium]